jgi:uroporphyrinogen-III synthase
MARGLKRAHKVWVTRSAPGAARTAGSLAGLGYETHVRPLLTVRPIAGVEIPLKGVGAVVFTSGHGVAAFAQRVSAPDLTVFAVGSATAAAARAAGFTRVLSTDGDVAAVAAGIVARRRELAGAVLHASAAERSGDLEGALAKEGIKVRTIAVYETAAAEIGEETFGLLPALEAVTVHSAKAARILAGILKAHPAPRLRACCLSRQVARPLARVLLRQLSAAARPTETALIDLFRS